MTDRSSPLSPLSPLRELVVPALMLLCIGFFIADSTHLSLEGWIFPAALILVVVGALGAALWPSLTGREPPPAAADDEEDDARGPILALRPWLLLALPAILCAFLDVVGVAVALVVAVGDAQFALGERSLLRNIAVPLAIVVPTWLIFKYALFVRFPPNLLGL